MPSYRLNVKILNQPDALAKLILLMKQGQLRILSIRLESSDGTLLTGWVDVEGQLSKVEWLSKKYVNFPVFVNISYEGLE